MNPLERNRWICFGKGALHGKDAQIARLREDFAAHFEDSIDYEPDTMINGLPQRLIVSKNKSVNNERKIYAYPGETFYAGDVVDCYDTKWLVTEVDQNKQIYTHGVMQRCNRELIWQNRKTGEIIRRWVTAEKPYYSNLNESKQLTISDREFKIQVTYDDETSLINLDKRFILEVIGDEPCAYKVTSVDTVTERFYEAGSVRGFLVLNMTQDLFDPTTDNAELGICDYIQPEKPAEPSPEPPPEQPTTPLSIEYNGRAAIRYGGSAKRFYVVGVEGGEEPPVWRVAGDIPDGKIMLRTGENDVWVQALDDVELEGKTFELSVTCGGQTVAIEVEVTA